MSDSWLYRAGGVALSPFLVRWPPKRVLPATDVVFSAGPTAGPGPHLAEVATPTGAPLPPGIDDPSGPGVGTPKPDHIWRQALRMPRVWLGGGILLAIVASCLLTAPWTLGFFEGSSLFYDRPFSVRSNAAPLAEAAEGGSGFVQDLDRPNVLVGLFGYDVERRSLLSRVLLGGVVSLGVGLAAATISVVLGVGVGLIAGYAGGRTDQVLMRIVDVMYGLPYVLLVILFKVGLEPPLERFFEAAALFDSPKSAASLSVMFVAIGLVSWLTMARVVRGQVLSLRDQPFIEAARAAGVKPRRIFLHHMLPNLVGPILVYATLTVPQAILQESFLSFLGIGVQPPLPSWGSLAADGLEAAINPIRSYWWQLLFPCLLLAVTLLSLNFLGDGLRDLFDPKRDTAKL